LCATGIIVGSHFIKWAGWLGRVYYSAYGNENITFSQVGVTLTHALTHPLKLTSTHTHTHRIRKQFQIFFFLEIKFYDQNLEMRFENKKNGTHSSSFALLRKYNVSQDIQFLMAVRN
jgi:hypothetical protein